LSEAESPTQQYLVHPIRQKVNVIEKRLQALDERFGDLIASYSLQNPPKSIRESDICAKENSNNYSNDIPIKYYDRVRLKTLSRPLKFKPIDYETQRDMLIQSYLS